MDAFVLGLWGDAAGYMGLIQDINLIAETLFVEFQYQALSKVMLNNYEKRGRQAGRSGRHHALFLWYGV